MDVINAQIRVSGGRRSRRRSIAHIIYETGSVGLPHGYLVREAQKRGLDTDEADFALALFLDQLELMGAIRVRKDKKRGIIGYYWADSSKKVRDYHI